MHCPALAMGASGELTLFLCGDVMTGRGVDQVFARSCPPDLYEPHVSSALEYVELAERASGPIPRPVDHAYVWGNALEVLDDVQPAARIINLETAITTSEDAYPKGINYRMHPDNVPVLTAAGIDCCVLANNHVLDWGEAGLLETLDTLARARIAAAGAGRNAAEARTPAVLAAGGGPRILVLGLGSTDSGVPLGWAAGGTKPGVHVLRDYSDASVDEVARIVDAAKRPGDVVIASIHWGTNWGYEIPRSHRRFAHALIADAAVDVVHGHSSHHPRAIEVYRDRPILYGCGDFIDDYEGILGYEEYRSDLALMYFPTLDARSAGLRRLEMVPLQVRRFRLHHAAERDRAWLREMLDRECRRYGGRITARGGVLALEWG
ncbi:MAG TPA: CapA family protein [Longimicrobiales bacterium]